MKKVVFLTNLIAMSAVLGMQNNVAKENRGPSKNPMRPVNTDDSRMISYESFTDRDWVSKIVRMRLNGEDFNAPQNADKQTILMCATRYADVKIMKQILNAIDPGKRLAVINAQDINGDTALSIAAKAGDDEKILLLLKNSADVELAEKKISGEALTKLKDLNTEINQHTGILLRNLLMENIDIAKSVLRSPYIKINTRGRDDGASILQMCANDGLTKQVSLLLTHPDIDINAQDKDGNTALIAAICNNHLDTVYSLLKHPKINVNLHNKTEDAPLMSAVYVGNVSMVKLLLNCKGIDVNKQTKYGITALMSAVFNNHQEIVKLLLNRRDIKINVQDNLGLSVLMYADLAGNSEIFKLLLNCEDIDVNLRDRNGKTALIRSAEGGNQEIVNLLLKDSMISFKDQDYQKSEAFLSAICFGHEEIVKLFLQNGIDINKRYFDDFTALMYAVEADKARIVNLLLQQPSIDINTQNPEGETALDIAKRKGRRSIIRLTQSKMAPQSQQFDPFIEKVKHLSSEKIYEEFIHAVSQGDINEMDSLLDENWEALVDVNTRDKNGDTALIIASENGNRSVVKWLLENKADLSLKDKNGDNALIRAARKGHFDVVEELLFQKANINSTGQHKRTPLMVAAENGHIRVVKLLIKKGAKVSIKNDYDKTALDIVNEKKLGRGNNNYESIESVLENAGKNQSKQSDLPFGVGMDTSFEKWEVSTDECEKDLKSWEKNDPDMYKKIRSLIGEMERDPFRGLGQPERLMGDLEGLYSRRINKQNRLVYEIDGEKVILKSCKGHYEKEKRNRTRTNSEI